MHNILHFNCGFLHTPHTHTHTQIETDKHTEGQSDRQRHKVHIGQRHKNSARSPRELHDALTNRVGGSINWKAQVVKTENANDK